MTVAHALLFVEPHLAVLVNPSEYQGVDVQPYNNFVLTCSAEIARDVIPMINIVWLQGGKELSNTYSTINITEGSGLLTNTKWKASFLQVINANVSSSGNYRCISRVSVEASPVIESSASAEVDIRGKRKFAP